MNPKLHITDNVLKLEDLIQYPEISIIYVVKHNKLSSSLTKGYFIK